MRLLAFTLIALLPLAATERASVTRFGVRPGQTTDARPGLRRAVAWLAARPGRTLVFPRGEYHFTPAGARQVAMPLSNTDPIDSRRVAIHLKDLRRARLQGQGARLAFEGRILPFALVGCEDVELSGFEIDWKRPLLSEAKVVGADAQGITLQIDPKRYPYEVAQGKLLFTGPDGLRATTWEYMEFDPATRSVAAGTGDVECLGRGWETHEAVAAGPGLVRLKAAFKRLPQVGHVLVAPHGVRDHASTLLDGSRDIRLRDITYRHTSGLGLLAQYCENVQAVRVHFRPAKGRLFSGHDDGFHFSNCKGQILVDRCSTQGLLDDGFNVRTSLVQVVARVDARTLRCHFPHLQSVNLRFADAGDELVGVDGPTMKDLGRARFAGLKRLGPEAFEATFDAGCPRPSSRASCWRTAPGRPPSRSGAAPSAAGGPGASSSPRLTLW